MALGYLNLISDCLLLDWTSFKKQVWLFDVQPCQTYQYVWRNSHDGKTLVWKEFKQKTTHTVSDIFTYIHVHVYKILTVNGYQKFLGCLLSDILDWNAPWNITRPNTQNPNTDTVKGSLLTLFIFFDKFRNPAYSFDEDWCCSIGIGTPAKRPSSASSAVWVVLRSTGSSFHTHNNRKIVCHSVVFSECVGLPPIFHKVFITIT